MTYLLGTVAVSVPARRSAGRSPSWPSTTARTSAASSGRTRPETVTYDEMVEFKRAVVRALAPVATGTLLDPEIGAAQAIHDGSMPDRAGLIVAVEATGYLGPRRPGSAGCSTAGAPRR